jgi:hypothetical protein
MAESIYAALGGVDNNLLGCKAGSAGLPDMIRERGGVNTDTTCLQVTLGSVDKLANSKETMLADEEPLRA